MLELFSPQKMPDLTQEAAHPVVAWSARRLLPWDYLQPPAPRGRTRMAWRHTVYLGVYDLADIYESMHRVFHDDRDAYDERPPGCSAGACIVLDQQGRLLGDSAVLSSALWAVGRARRPGISDPAWMRGFDRAQQRFGQAVAGLDADRVGAGDPRDAPPYTGTDLAALLAVAHRCAGIAEVGGLATDRIVIASRQVSARRSAELGNVDFLNSFFLADLDEVKGHVRAGELGPALASYLAPSAPDPRQRTDVVTDQEAVLPQTGAGRIPPGRWPAEPTHPLALSQQFAVNQALWELGGSAGLLGVNGPPGTGKTTMLRDLLAGNVVERARRLADLSRAEEAFTQVRHRWQGDGHRREVPGLVPSLTGYEMVVASANNAAVENVSEQIPGTSAIAERWRGGADYYADLASALLERQTAEHTDSDPVPEPGDTDVPGSSPTEATSGIQRASETRVFAPGDWWRHGSVAGATAPRSATPSGSKAGTRMPRTRSRGSRPACSCGCATGLHGHPSGRGPGRGRRSGQPNGGSRIWWRSGARPSGDSPRRSGSGSCWTHCRDGLTCSRRK